MSNQPLKAPLCATERSEEVLAFLSQRRSTLAKLMTEEAGPNDAAPTEAEVEQMLEIASRVPDHRKIVPWRFALFQGQARADFGDELAARFAAITPSAKSEHIEFERSRFLRVPLVVAVVSSPIDCPRGTPKWEQELASGAVCFNLLLAARAMGFAGQWLTEWYGSDSHMNMVLGLSSTERVAGYIYIGNCSQAIFDRPRPEMPAIVQNWRKTAN